MVGPVDPRNSLTTTNIIVKRIYDSILEIFSLKVAFFHFLNMQILPGTPFLVYNNIKLLRKFWQCLLWIMVDLRNALNTSSVIFKHIYFSILKILTLKLAFFFQIGKDDLILHFTVQ